MLFDIFKRRKQNQESISARLTTILEQRPNNLHITIFIQNQVLFQVMPAKNFLQHGFETDKPDDFVVLHFFNKNKTLTFDKMTKIKDTAIESDYYYFEEPKGNHNYLKLIGHDPNEIEREIYNCFREIYDLKNLNEISIDYADY